MRRGPTPGAKYPLTATITQIGRGTRNDIIIDDNEVSREHCRIVLRDGQHELYDLASATGTFVNGQRVDDTAWVLQDTCYIELGDSVTFEFRVMPDEELFPIIGTTRPVATYIPELTQAYFIVRINNEDVRATYTLEQDTITFGRAADNTISIIQPEISRYHLRLQRTLRGYVLEDLKSTNGTVVNGKPLTEPHLLISGDIVRIGTTITIQYTTDLDDAEQNASAKVDTNRLPQMDTTHLKRRTSLVGAIADGGQGETRTTIGSGMEPETLANQVLILYGRELWEEVVAPLYDQLTQSGVPAWVEQYLAPGSEDWHAAMEQARVECWLLLVVVSPNTLRHDHVMKTWRYFHNREKDVVLLIHSAVERLPIGATRAQKIIYNPQMPEISFQQVVRTIRSLQKQD